MRIDIVTLFPGLVKAPLAESMIRRARERGIADLRIVNLRAYGIGRHRVCDDKPFGGGAGMVMKPEPIFAAVKKIRTGRSRVILMSASGRPFTQGAARRLAREKHLILLCGHYEGVDERVAKTLADEELSLGDFVLTGGEIPALAVVDAVVRLLPGCLGNSASHDSESFYAGRLDYPHYTRPQAFRGMRVPSILVSGDHRAVRAWREREALAQTRRRRPDLLKRSSR